MKPIFLALILAALLLSGCADLATSFPKGIDLTPTPTFEPSSVPEPTQAPPSGPVIRAPAFDVLLTELRTAGFTVQPGEAANEPFFSVPGSSAKVNGKPLEVFEYPNAAARQNDSDKISPDGFQVGNSMVDWIDQPHFYARGVALVLYVGRDPAVLAQLAAMYGASLTK